MSLPPIVKCFIALAFWLAIGITWYTQWHGWSSGLAFFFHVQACLSVGYANPGEDWICDLAPNEMDHLHDTVKYYILAPGMQYPKPEEGGRGGCVAGDISKAVTTLLVLSGSVLMAATVGTIAQIISSPVGGWYTKLNRHEKLLELKRMAKATSGWSDDFIVEARRLYRKSWFKALVLLLIWLIMGTAWGMASYQRMSFLSALYFSFSSISTAGVESVLLLGPDTPNGAQVGLLEVDEGTWIFVGIYLLISLPLYGWALGVLAADYVERLTEHDRSVVLNQPFVSSEFRLSDYLGFVKKGCADGQIDMFEFVECQLLRLNMVSVSQLFDIKKRFIELDTDGSGCIERSEIQVVEDVTVQKKKNKQLTHALATLEKMSLELLETKKRKAGMSMQEKERVFQETRSLAEQQAIERALDRSWSRMHKTAWFQCLFAFLVWLFMGIIFYTQWQGWDFWVAFYYTLQTGMSVGFGNPSEDSLCDASDDRIPAGAWHYVKGDGMQYTPISENGRGGCMAGDISKLFSVILILVGSSVIASAIGIIANSLLNPSGAWYKQLIKEEELKHLRQQAAETEGWADDVAIYIKIFLRKGVVKAIIALNLWIAVGVIYGCFSFQRMTFVTALYFSVTAIATGGLEGLKYLGDMTDTPKGAAIEFEELPGWNWAFLALYMVVGIPLYGWALTEIASWATSSINDQYIEDTLNAPLTEDEFKLLDYLGEGESDGKVDMFEFVQCQLFRLNLVSVNDLFDIKRLFLDLDLDGGGTIDRKELEASGTSFADEEFDRAMQYAFKALDRIHADMKSVKQKNRRASMAGKQDLQGVSAKVMGQTPVPSQSLVVLQAPVSQATIMFESPPTAMFSMQMALPWTDFQGRPMISTPPPYDFYPAPLQTS